MNPVIPVFEPEILAQDRDEVLRTLERGEISGSGGQSLADFEREFADYCGCRHGVAVTSGTTALHLACHAAGFQEGDEILVSACTNIGTALGAFHLGATLVPVDSEPLTWNLDLDLVEKLITPKTRGILPVHFLGHPVDMDRLMEIAARHRLMVIEDAAEAHGAKIRGRRIGAHGQMACFSFYANKIITTGEGGMVLTNDDALAEKLRLLRNLGFTQPRFRHEVAAYNFRMTAYQAALGLAQLRRIDGVLRRKEQMAAWYQEELEGVQGLEIPKAQPWAEHVYWMYGIRILPSACRSRDQVAELLRGGGIDTRTFFCPMNQQPCFVRPGRLRPVPCPVADDLWNTGLLLPSSHTLQRSEIRKVADAVKKALAP